jgi:hypothetical protein
LNNKAKPKLAIKLAIFTLLCFTLVAPVGAQGIDVSAGNDIGLGTITLPTFLSLPEIQNFSFFSYVALLVSLIFIVLALFWIVLIIRGSINIIYSQGNEDQIGAGYKKFGNVFWSITYLFGFFVILNLVAGFFGLGAFWEWPKRLSICNDSTFYFAKALEVGTTDQEAIDAACF